MDFLHGDARHLGPGFVGVSVVIQDYLPSQKLSKVTGLMLPPLFYLHLLPNIKATVSSLYSLPGRPLTDGFVILSR